MNAVPLADFMQLLASTGIEFSGPVYVVEMGITPTSDPSLHEPYTEVFSLVCQIQGGLKIDRVLYIGTDKEKARLIHDTYLKAATHARCVLGIEDEH